MSKFNLYIIILSVSIITIGFRILPIFIQLPENNKKLNNFFELMPVAILSALAFPEIFTSMGKDFRNIAISFIATFVVLYMSYKKRSLSLSIVLSFAAIILIKEGLKLGNI